METQTRVRKAITYLNGAISYLDSPKDDWSIKQAKAYIRNARGLLSNMKLTNADKLISDIKELVEAKK
jgi:hypothetical protein